MIKETVQLMKFVSVNFIFKMFEGYMFANFNCAELKLSSMGDRFTSNGISLYIYGSRKDASRVI